MAALVFARLSWHSGPRSLRVNAFSACSRSESSRRDHGADMPCMSATGTEEAVGPCSGTRSPPVSMPAWPGALRRSPRGSSKRPPRRSSRPTARTRPRPPSPAVSTARRAPRSASSATARSPARPAILPERMGSGRSDPGSAFAGSPRFRRVGRRSRLDAPGARNLSASRRRQTQLVQGRVEGRRYE